ncbi:MAG2810 family protein [Mycoplasma tauri]|uniref:Uncharacterized protein n=1 Tax=Mycoplasma tauri TaxID=547987 RepID=A0A953T4Y6_9MOLU|nr:hypothetical protein [Mycoplasma tauri]MBZ4195480.1 hypothetical protein [Mycoplasma tauri]MBZ4203888.1 hypothetical protein [Mycoplasma tauri]MBZ4204116.1 hypothetical protein [Mycoplasma tauri]MBZ4218091.1 hypothetical protein [Mycoplasma tauri]MBZ4226512.1 hypothetical protein [Mycoplasma tauri]
MEKYNLILSKEKFYDQQFLAVKNTVKEKINNFYADKKNLSKLYLSHSGFWAGLSIFCIGLLLLSITFLLFCLILFWAPNHLSEDAWLRKYNNYFPLLISLITLSLAMIIPGSITYWFAIKAKKYVKANVISSINNRILVDYFFKYFELTPQYLDGDSSNINYESINFYKNTNNIKDLKNYNLITQKYEMYEARTRQQYIKMQNLLFRKTKWCQLDNLSKKVYKKALKNKKLFYKDRIEITEDELYFGIAAKLINLDKNVNLTLFDDKDNYTPDGYKLLNESKQIMNLNLRSSNSNALDKWVNDSNNLQYLIDLKNTINKTTINVPDKKSKIKNHYQKIDNLGMLIRNQEAFIWFKTPFELLDMHFEIYTFKKDKLVDLYVNKILDDAYVVYLVMQLLTPFGFDINIKINDIEVQEANRKKEQTKSVDLFKSEPKEEDD